MKNPTCCCDMDIDLLDLFFPDRMSEEGQEFVKEHGIESETIASLREGAIKLNNGMVKIFHRCQHLTDEGLCNIYATRPSICEEFDCSRRTDCECKGTGRV